jgi:hypothetical protein
MALEKIIVKKYSNYSIFFGIILLIGLICMVSYFIILGPIQQCASVELCGKPEPTKFVFSWIRLTLSLIIIMGGILGLFMTPLFGGLKDRERKVLKWIYYKNKEKPIAYKLLKILREKEKEFKKVDNNQIYRIINRLKKFGYVEIGLNGNISITEWGESYVQKINY